MKALKITYELDGKVGHYWTTEEMVEKLRKAAKHDAEVTDKFWKDKIQQYMTENNVPCKLQQEMIVQIARICYEANRAYCESIGDYSFKPYAEASDWQKATNESGVEFHMRNPHATPQDSHNSWLRQKEADGWKYGPVKDAEKKEHPCYVPYEELPLEQQMKDYIFCGIVKSMIKKYTAANMLSGGVTRGQQVMSVQFNPGQRKDVAEIKQIMADTFDLIDRHVKVKLDKIAWEPRPDVEVEFAFLQRGNDISRLAAVAKTSLETAQMYAVKAVTR
jgi:hypothetical protein